ncbi:C2 domain-containing protein [Aureococcus anophagefferens]|nr:C2 domain-containing protein [Aureococcus anophagefferens]
MVREGQVAVDCEWGANAAHEGASLLQLATRGLRLGGPARCQPPAVHKLLADVADLAFASRHVVVLGFDGEANDLPHLRARAPARLVFPAAPRRYATRRRLRQGRRLGGGLRRAAGLRPRGVRRQVPRAAPRQVAARPRLATAPLTEAAVATRRWTPTRCCSSTTGPRWRRPWSASASCLRRGAAGPAARRGRRRLAPRAVAERSRSPPPRPAASPPPPADGWGTPSSHAGGWGRASPDAGAWGRARSRSPDARGRSPDRRVAWSPTASSFQSPQSDSDAEDARRAEFYGALRDWLEKDVLDRAAKGCSTRRLRARAERGQNRPLPCPLRPHSYGTLRVVRACRCRGGNRSFDGSSFEDKLLRLGGHCRAAAAPPASDPGHALLFNWLKARYGSTALRALPPLPTADDDGDDDDEAAGEPAAARRRRRQRLAHATPRSSRAGPRRSTALRDAAALVGAYRERHAPVGDCWVVDQSLELGGDGLAAHASLRAERYPPGEALHEAMLRVLRNHTPAAIVVDELVDRAAAWRRRTSAHARSLAELVDDAALAPVLGDFETVTLSDREAARRAKTQRDPRKARFYDAATPPPSRASWGLE